MRKGRLARLARLGGMAAGLATDAAGAAANLLVDTQRDAEIHFHRHAARRMMRVFGEMKGLPLKAGQMLSYIDEMLPPEHRHIYNEMLGSLQMHTPPMEWEDIQAVFHEDFDGKGPEEVFLAFDHEPLAAASIGQVYHAVMHDGSHVAVKVQYPGVAKAIESDLENAESLMSAMSHVMPKADFRHFVEDIISRIQEECDYEMECRNQQDFFQAWEDDTFVVVPQVVENFCTKRVLTSEFLHAHEWKEMLAITSDAQKVEYGKTIFRFVFQSLFCHSMFNGDPHPGNYMFYDDGRVAFIDYGCVQRYPVEQAEGFKKLRSAVLERVEGPEFQALLCEVFGVPEDLDPEMARILEDYMHLTFEPITAPQPYKFTREYAQKLLKQGMDAKMVMTKKLLTGKNVNIFDNEHRGVAFLGRINFGLGSILTTLGTSADFRSMVAGMGE